MIGEVTKEIRPELKIYIKWVLSGLIDAVSLILWGILQYWSNEIISQFRLSSVDSWVFNTLQFLLAISTLAPIAAFIYKDIAIMWIRTHRSVKQEIEAGQARQEEAS